MLDNLAYQEEPREELIDGEIVAMSPRPGVIHNFIAGNIFNIFSNYLRGKLCTPIMDGTDLFLTEKDHYVPDFMVVCDPKKIEGNGVHGAPDLVVEVLSPSSIRRDRVQKMRTYERCGVREFWLVDAAAKSVEQYLLEDGRFVPHTLCAVIPDWQMETMTEKEREEVVTEFPCGLFDDLTIRLEDVFYRVF